MEHLNVEIKAKCNNPQTIRNYLQLNNAKFAGTDRQTDTYFNVSAGRLKLREGNIENNLIFYNRNNQPGPKCSFFRLLPVADPDNYKKIMKDAMGIKTVVIKTREIYYIGNVKFHIDEVENLGSFIEIEAGNLLAPKTKTELEEQCNFYLQQFGIRAEDLFSESYSDLLTGKQATG